MRRIIIIAVVAISLIGLGVLAYFAFFASPANVTVTPTNVVGLPGAGQATTTVSSDTAVPVPTVVGAVGARLVKISAGPVVPGVAVVSSTASTSPGFSVHYIERQSGNVFSYSSATRSLTRTSNKTIPGIQSALWLPGAATALVQYLSGSDFSTINTYLLSADGGSGSFLTQNLAGIAASSAGILTLASGVNGSSASVARADGTRAVEVFTTPLSSVRASFAGKNTYLVFTKPSSDLDGYAFVVDSARRFTRIAGPLPGLVALASPSGATVLVSYSSGGALRTELVDVATGKETALPVATIVDKCAWAADSSAVYCGVPTNSPSGYAYPDDWYQGAISFSDRLWKINVAGRYAELVLDFSKEVDAPLDAQSLATDDSNKALSFVNKVDGSLWVYAL